LLFQQISVIAFDLDDTLWPCMPTIHHAEQTLYRWLEEHYPRIPQRYSFEAQLSMRREFMHRNKKYQIDLSLMRRDFLKYLARLTNYAAEQLAAEGFEVFIKARNEVVFYDDVLPTLKHLKSSYKIGSISNGNANVHRVGLGDLVEHSLNAADLMVAKPEAEIFHQLALRSGHKIEHCLYVGDDPHCDIFGAVNAGMQAIWINREKKVWPTELEPPEYEIHSLHELPKLLQLV